MDIVTPDIQHPAACTLLYADDFFLLASHCKVNLEHVIQKRMIAAYNTTTLHLNEVKFLIFNPNKPGIITVNGSNLPIIERFKYLESLGAASCISATWKKNGQNYDGSINWEFEMQIRRIAKKNGTTDQDEPTPFQKAEEEEENCTFLLFQSKLH